MNRQQKEELKVRQQGDHAPEDGQQQLGQPRQQNQQTGQSRQQDGQNRQQGQEAFQPINTD
jgi:hypothetical protein